MSNLFNFFSTAPSELFQFTYGFKKFLYTSGQNDIIIGFDTYKAVVINRSKISRSQDSGKSPLIIKMGLDIEFARLFFQSPPATPIMVTIKRKFGPEYTDYSIIVSGRITGNKYSESEAEFTVETIQSMSKRSLLRRFYQSGCPHVLYDSSCKVSQQAYEKEAILTSSTNVVLYSPDFALQADGYFTGGFVNIDIDSVIERRYIANHIGDALYLQIPIYNIQAGQKVQAYPGCPRNVDFCISKFNNLENFGGFPYFPKINPYGGSQIF